MIRKSLVVLAISAALIAGAFAGTGNAQKSTVTVGDFAVRVTKALGQPAATPRAAVSSLKSLGVKIGDENSSLTEGMASRILADLGLRVSTSSPNAAVTSAKADQMAAVAGLASAVSSTTPASGLPTFCLQQRNRGQCDQCCQTALGCDVDSSICAGGICAHFCASVLPPGQTSPDEPQP